MGATQNMKLKEGPKSCNLNSLSLSQSLFLGSTQPGASCMPSKHFTSELPTQLKCSFYKQGGIESYTQFRQVVSDFLGEMSGPKD
jgi:hypothetical protein